MNINKIQEVIELGFKENSTFYTNEEKALLISYLFEEELECFIRWLNTKRYETFGVRDKDFAQWYNKEINRNL